MVSRVCPLFTLIITSAIIILSGAHPLHAGSLSGRVTSEISSDPLVKIVVEVIALPLNTFTSCTLDPNGRYECMNLPEGEYLIRASGGDSGYISEYYQSAQDYYTATLINLTVNQKITGLDFQLKTGKSISGTITDEETGLPIPGIGVIVFGEEAIPPSSPYYPYGSPTIGNYYNPGLENPFIQSKSGVTDTNGHYEIKGLPPGRYFVSAGNNEMENIDLYIPEFFKDAFSPFTASLVPVAATEGTGGINMQLIKGGGISGRVADTTGMGVEGVVVRAECTTQLMCSYGAGGMGSTNETMTDSNGRYAMRGLVPGTFTVSLGDQASGFSGNYSVVVEVTKGTEVTGCDFIHSTTGRKITGHVYSAKDGSPVGGMSVVCTTLSYPYYTPTRYYSAYGYGYGGGYGYYPSFYGYDEKQGITDTAGAYLLDDIYAGQYFVQAIKSPFFRGNLNRYIAQIYTVSERKTPVYVLPSQFEVSGVDFSLTVGGSIAGAVLKRLDGSPIQGILVIASPLASYYPYYYSAYSETDSQGGFAFTGKDGKYRIDGLDQGGYRVSVVEKKSIYAYTAAPYPSPRVIEYIDPTADTFYFNYYGSLWQDPRCVWVNPPEEIAGIDFELIKGGSISGVVSAQDTGDPLPTIQVMAVRIYNPPPTTYPYDYYGGAYSGSSYLGYYGGVTSMSNAGYIGYYGGYYGWDYYVYSATTDMNGFYSIEGLHEGEYELSVYDLKNTYSSSEEKVLQLQEGEALIDQNFVMVPLYRGSSGSISGAITSEADGSPILNIYVTAQRFPQAGPDDEYPYPSPWLNFPYSYGSPYGTYYTYGGYGGSEYQFYAVTDINGQYTITGLPPGEFMVTCTGTEGGQYMRECYVEYPNINLSDLHYTPLIRMEKDLNSQGESYSYLQVKFQAIHAFDLHLVLRDIQGKDVPVLIKLGRYGPNTCEGIFLGDERCGYSHDYDIDNEKGSWSVLEIEMDELLIEFYINSACFSVGPAAPYPYMGLDSLVSIGFEGNGFNLDYIRLKHFNPDIDYIYIDGFNYIDGPAAHGWQITSPFPPHITMLTDVSLEGGGGMRVLAETPVQVAAEGSAEDIDMALSGGGLISGNVRKAEDGQSLPGTVVRLFRIDRYSYYEDPYYATTDGNGAYTIGGIRPGTYSLVAEGDKKSGLTMQWYDAIQPVIEGYSQGYYYYYGLSDFMPIFTLKKLGLTDSTHPILEFMALSAEPFSLSLDVVTVSGEQAKIKFHNSVGSPSSGFISDTILVPLPGNSSNISVWSKTRFDLNEILAEYLLDQLQQVTGIWLRGRFLCIDYIKLTQEGYADQVIDDFIYEDSPLNHGWITDGTVGFTSVYDSSLGHSYLLLSASTPLSINEGTTKRDIDFSLRPFNKISGLVTDTAEGASIPGIQISAIAPGTSQGYSFYNYNAPALSCSNGVYILQWLFPGKYRVKACDPEGYFMPALYKDIAVTSQPEHSVYYSTSCSAGFNCSGDDLAILIRDLTSLAIENPILTIDMMYEGRFDSSLQIETTDGSSLELRFQTGDAGPDGWAKEWDEEAHTGALLIDITQESIYNDNQISGNAWYSWKVSLDEIVALGFSKIIQDINQIAIEGNFFKVASIRFLQEEEPEQLVDAFDYSDSPENHGWVIGRPATTHPVIVWDPLIDEWVLECSSAELVTVEEGLTTQGIDFHLQRGNRVTGKVTDAAEGTPLTGIRVYAGIENIHDLPEEDYYSVYYYPYIPSSYITPSAEAYTDQNGRYTLLIGGSSEPQKYYIEARDEIRRIYVDTSYPSPLELGYGAELTDIDIGMSKGGTITGKVTFFESDIPAQDALVECRIYYEPPVYTYDYTNYGLYGSTYGQGYGAQGYYGVYTDPTYQYGEGGYSYGSYPYPRYRIMACARTDPEGNYRITGLPEGGYVIYSQSKDLFFEGYYKDSGDYLDPPFVSSGEETAGIDIRLYPKGQGSSYSVPYQGSYYSSQAQYGTYQSAYSGSSGYGQGYANPSYAPQYLQSTQDVPTITSQPGLDAYVGKLYAYQVSIEDPNGWGDLKCRLIDAPAGMKVDGQTWLIQWTPTLDQIGDHLVRVGIDASVGGVARQDFAVHVYPYMIIESAEGEESPLLNGEWGIIQGSGTLTATNDTELKSPVLSMQTAEEAPLDFRISYPVGDALDNPRPYLCFAVKCEKDFHFCVEVVLGGSPFTLIYAPIGGDCVASGATLFYPIGSEYKNGLWHLCTRDLRKDLSVINAPFESVSRFEIWGDCRIDDIWLSYQAIDHQVSTIRIYPGLNLISLPVQADEMDSDTLAQLFAEVSIGDVRMRRRNAYLGKWEDTFDMVRDDQGFVLYSPDGFFITFKGTQKKNQLSSLHTFLKSGANLISPLPLHGKPYHAAEVLRLLKPYKESIQGIQMYDQERGQWRSRVQFFGRSSGPDFEIHQGKGYIVDLGE
jgi:hypothetical protein